MNPVAENKKVSQEQIESWKAEHVDITRVNIGVKEAYFKAPSRKAYSYASKVASTDPLQFNEIILKDCFIGGDKELIDNERYFLTMSGHVKDLLGIMESSLEKL